MELPFQQVVKIPELQSNMNAVTNIEIEKVDYKLIGGNQLQITVEMIVNTTNSEELVLNSIKNVELTEEALPKMPSIIVYYVKSGDTLWNIAKRYQTKVEDIKAINDLKDDVIYPNQQLIIQKIKVVKEDEVLL